MVTVHREGRTSQAPLGGSRKDLDPRDARRVCEELGLDWSDLPGPKSRV
jgi:mRNA interferase HicA